MTITTGTIAVATKTAPKRSRKMAREPQAERAEPPITPPLQPDPKPRSKASRVLAMLQRAEGATIDATGWLPHTTRAALTGLKKKGYSVTSEKLESGTRIYRVTAA